ncbi:MAG: aminopeptidase [Spirochaetaceae bacterium]|nr:MAG: aminopeptidase [Spirochaetaceae bacterium]
MLRDPRMAATARIIVRHALKVKPGAKVMIDALDECEELIIEVIDALNDVGALPYMIHESIRVRANWLRQATKEQMDLWFTHKAAIRREMDHVLQIRGQENWSELADVPPENLRYFGHLHIRMGKEGRKDGANTTIIRYPSKSLAQQGGMSTDAFTDLFFKLSTMNFTVLHREMEPLKEAIDNANDVRIVAPGTDLSFSIAGLTTDISAGTWNIPDGETAMTIVRESANGRIAYNVPSSHQGLVFRDIALTFKDGKIIEVEADERENMEAILDTDEGARHIGEFAIGVNPYLRHHMIDTLYDEKMAGSLHFTPGGRDSSGRLSSVHWDIVQSHLPPYSGGEIYLDGKLWRKDGLFVDEALSRLNPDTLQAILEETTELGSWC